MRYFYISILAFVYSSCANADEANNKLASSSLNSTEGLLQWMFSTIFVVALIFLFAYLIKKMRFIPKMSSDLSIITQLSIGPKERLVKVKVGDRHILLGVTPSSISYLCDVNTKDQSFDSVIKKEIEKDKIVLDSKQDGKSKVTEL